MDYGVAGQKLSQTTATDRIPLERIGEYADELGRVAGYISDFIARCRGPQPEPENSKLSSVPSGHLGQIDRLGDQLHRVDCLARELQTIG
jgi:hypothetical protein